MFKTVTRSLPCLNQTKFQPPPKVCTSVQANRMDVQDYQYDHDQEVLNRVYPSNFAPRERSEPARAATSKMSRYHPYRASGGDSQQKPYFSDTSATLGTLSPRYSVPACSALAGPEAASHPYESLLEAVYLPLKSRTPRSSTLDTCMTSIDNRAAMLSRAKQVLWDSQNVLNTMGTRLMGRSISLTDELEAATNPERAALDTIVSPQRSQSEDLCTRPSYLQYDDGRSDTDSDEDDLESHVDTEDELPISCPHPEKPFSSPSVEPLGSVTDRVAKFEHIAQTSQSEESTQTEVLDYTQQPAVRTPRGTLRGVLPCGLSYRLNRISESSERSSLAVSAFEDVDAMNGNADGALTARSWCNSVVSEESDYTEYNEAPEEDSAATHSTEECVPIGTMQKVARVVVPTLQLKHLALKMPRITEEVQGEASTEASRISAQDDATPRPHLGTAALPDGAALPEASADISTSEHIHPEEDALSASYQRPRQESCSNPFIDEQEPSTDEGLQVPEPAETQRPCAAADSSAPTPRSDLVFGLHISAAPQASRSLPSTHDPTPCMSLIHEGTSNSASDDASASLPVEQPLTPLVDTITCGGYQGDPRQLRAQNPGEDASCGDGGAMKAGRQDGSKAAAVPTGPLKTPRAQRPTSEASLELLEMSTAATMPTASNSVLTGLRQESRSSEMAAERSEATVEECLQTACELAAPGSEMDSQKSCGEGYEDTKENMGDVLNVSHSPSRQPVPRLTLPKQYSAHALAKMMRATAQRADTNIASAQTKQSSSPSSTTAEHASVAQSSLLNLLTPRGNHMQSPSAALSTGVMDASVQGANTSPGWMSCWSALSSPDQLHMQHSQRSLGTVDETQLQHPPVSWATWPNNSSVMQGRPPATPAGAASPCSKVITNGLFNPARVPLAGSAEASMHLMNPKPSNTISAATLSNQAEVPPTANTKSEQQGSMNTKGASDDSKVDVSVGGVDVSYITSPPPPPESEPSNCELRDALTLAVQQRDAALEEFLAADQSKLDAQAAAEKLRNERDRALEQVGELTHELAQCKLTQEAQERTHNLKLQALHSELETLRNATSNTLQEASAMRKALNIQRLKKEPHGKAGSKKTARAAKRAAQLFGPLSVPSTGATNGPRWLKETYCSVLKSQPSPRCETHRLESVAYSLVFLNQSKAILYLQKACILFMHGDKFIPIRQTCIVFCVLSKLEGMQCYAD